jgi:hypothetical protein
MWEKVIANKKTQEDEIIDNPFKINLELLVGGDVLVDSEALLVIDFVNLKIKLAQSFRSAHKGRVRVRVFIRVSVRMCMNIYICTIFLKKRKVGFGILNSYSKYSGRVHIYLRTVKSQE